MSFRSANLTLATTQLEGISVPIEWMTLRLLQVTPSPTTRTRRKGASLLSRGIKTGLGYFLPWQAPWQLSGRPRAPISPCQANVAQGRANGQGKQNCQYPASLSGAGFQGEPELEWETSTISYATRFPHKMAARPSEKGYPGSTKAHVFLIIHSFIHSLIRQ